MIDWAVRVPYLKYSWNLTYYRAYLLSDVSLLFTPNMLCPTYNWTSFWHLLVGNAVHKYSRSVWYIIIIQFLNYIYPGSHSDNQVVSSSFSNWRTERWWYKTTNPPQPLNAINSMNKPLHFTHANLSIIIVSWLTMYMHRPISNRRGLS